MSKNTFSVTAIVAIRNGAYYFTRLCEHFSNNGISLAVIDNDSEDNLQELIQQNHNTVVSSTMLDYDGTFDLTKQLQAKQELSETLDSDWLIHLDVDELLFSDKPGETLLDGIKRVDAQGFDAVNFDEFIFLPIALFKDYNSYNFHKMRWYYFFEPRPTRLIRAFRSNLRTKIESGGHDAEGIKKLYSRNMIMRHYIFRNKSHAKLKYKDRKYSQVDIQNNFHGNRLLLQNSKLILPARKKLLRSIEGQWTLDNTAPQKEHFWQWGNS